MKRYYFLYSSLYKLAQFWSVGLQEYISVSDPHHRASQRRYISLIRPLPGAALFSLHSSSFYYLALSHLLKQSIKLSTSYDSAAFLWGDLDFWLKHCWDMYIYCVCCCYMRRLVFVVFFCKGFSLP